MGKARMASAFRKPTAQFLEQWKDRPLFPQSLTSVLPGEITLNPGGYPIFENGEFIGAIGVGRGSPSQDDAVARLASGWSDEADPSPCAPPTLQHDAHSPPFTPPPPTVTFLALSERRP